MLFRRKIRSLRRIPCPCFAGKHPLSSVAAADAAEELVSDSGVWDTKSCSREILALSNLELGLYLSCRSNSNVVAEKGVLKQKEMVSCPRWSEQDPRLARLEVCHALAKEGRLRQMRKILRQMLGDEGFPCFPLLGHHHRYSVSFCVLISRTGIPTALFGTC